MDAGAYYRSRGTCDLKAVSHVIVTPSCVCDHAISLNSVNSG